MALTAQESIRDELSRDFAGELIAPGDAGYDEARRVWNGAIDRRPSLIARCTGTADVIAAVKCARANEQDVAIRGGGHSNAGHSMIDGGIVIDCSPMKGIRVDPASRTATAQPGVVWGELDRETQAFGLGVTGGEVSDTGIAGLTLGGGIGWLKRMYGLTCDNLLSVDLVTAEGELVRASENENAELYWGVRGAGHNFGVVTQFEYRLHPVGPLVLAGFILYPLDRAADVLRFTRDFCDEAPDEVTVTSAIITAPPAPFVPEALHNKPVLAVVPCYVGPVEEGERALRPLREYGPPAADLVEPTPYVTVQRFIDETYPPGRRIYIKSEWLRGLEDGAIDKAIEGAERFDTPLSQIILHQMGGALARVPDDATAFDGRDARYMATIIAVWEAPDDDREPHVTWARELWEQMKPWSTGGSYVNHMMDEGDARVHAAYGHGKYERLLALKNMYDPTNFFRLNQNIKPTAG
jgi:FAD binding domain-containing protein/berberine-like enzyme